MPDPEFTWQQTDDRFVMDGPGGRVTFARTDDRWTHHLAFRAGPAPLVDRAGLTENVVGIEMNEHVETFQPKGAVEQAYDDLFGADGPLLQAGK